MNQNKVHCEKKRIKTFLKWVFILFIFCLPLDARASHVVGGELNYSCLGNDQYEITLTVYRDCFFGLTDFDDPAAIGIFNASGVRLDSLMLPLMMSDTLNPLQVDTCLLVPNNICVSTTTYRRIVHLPKIPGGYILAYQRCCRNETINNIVSPSNTGATFTVEITEKALNECNSNAKFKDWPPIFICVNEPIFFDQSATDLEGDSIAYKLCTPLAAGDSLNNRPQPPLGPPYDEVQWLSPTYSLENVLGFGQPLKIDPVTGILTGLPTMKGQYVVGICIEEYRDGVMISRTRRDFQYNVGDCAVSVSDFQIPEVQCENFEVKFENKSQNANNFIWHFNDPANPGATSTERNPTYTYSDTGRYEIMLVTSPGQSCSDTSYSEIYIKNSTLSTDFNFSFTKCDISTVTLDLTDNSTDSYAPPVSWLWELSDGQSSTLQNPQFTLASNQNIGIKLTVESKGGCFEVMEKQIEMGFAEIPAFALPKDTFACGEVIQLVAGTSPDIQYFWATDRMFDNVIQNGAAISIEPDGNQLYYIRGVNNFGCERVDSIEIKGNIIDVDLTGFEFLCKNESKTISIANLDADDNLQYTWSPTNDIISGSNSPNPVIQSSIPGTRELTVDIRDDAGCSIQRIVTIAILETAPQNIFPSQQGCDNLTLSFQNPSVNAPYYTWNFGDPSDPDASAKGASVSYTYASPGTYTVTLTPDPGVECGLQPIVKQVEVREKLRELDFGWKYNACQNDAIVAFENKSQNFQGTVRSWFWEFSTGVTSNQVNPVILVPTSQTLNVRLTATTSDGCVETISRPIAIDIIDLNLPSSLINCEGGPTVLNEGGNPAYSYQWSPTANLSDPTAASPEALPSENTTYTVTITNGSCEIVRNTTLLISTVNVNTLEDSIVVCNGNGVPLNAGVMANPDFSFSWSPVEGLDDPNAANPIATPDRTTTYTATIRDVTNDCVVSKVIKAVVPNQSLQAAFNLEYQECLDSAVVEFKDASLYSFGNIVSWDWQFSNGESSDQPNPKLSFSDEQSLGVTLTVTTQEGCVDTKTDQVDIQLLNIDLPLNSYVCQGSEVMLNPGGNSNYQYSWMPLDGSVLNDPNAVSPLASPESTTEYLVTIRSDALNCTTERRIVATVPEYTTTVDFEWNYEQCSDNATIALKDLSSNSGLDITSWAWTFSNGQQSDLQNPKLTFDNDQTLMASLTIMLEDGCEKTLASRPVVVDVIDLDLPDSLLVCNGSQVVLNENGDPKYAYNWAPGTEFSNPQAVSPVVLPQASTEYFVTVTDQQNNGTCQLEKAIKLQLSPQIGLTLNNDNSTTCDAEILLIASTINPASIRWALDPQFNEIVSTESGYLARPGRPSTYYVEATDEFGCTVADTTTITSYAMSYKVEGPAQICKGDTTTLSLINLNPEDELMYNWSPDVEIIRGNKEAAITVSPLESVQYILEIENQFGCIVTETIGLNVVNLSDLFTISADPPVIFPGQQSQLNINGDNTSGYNYTWIPPNPLNDNNISNPVATINETTTFAVIVEDEMGCIGQGVVTVEINDASCDEPFIFVPKGFTPNGDGKNDELMVRGNPIDELTFVIYNRWGQKVFETNDKNTGWDGKYEGKDLNPDVYGYYLKVTCLNGDEFFKKGNVTLIR